MISLSEYEIGKEVQKIQQELENIKTLLEQVYVVLDYNIKNAKLEEPKEKERK